MPFIGKDWRAPGETWVRVNHTAGWEQIKLRPIQLMSCPSNSSIDISLGESPKLTTIVPSRALPIKRHESSVSLSSSEENFLSSSSTSANEFASGVMRSDSEDFGVDDDMDWQPHCFVKTTRSKEFIGCTSMSEAFHRLDVARAVVDVRRFNYICKVVQILVHEKLQNISATARKHLFAIIQAMVIHSVDQDVHVSTARDLLNKFSTGLEEGHVCGSPQLVSRQIGTVNNFLDMIVDGGKKPTTLSDSSEDSMTFMDLPLEVISHILKRIIGSTTDHITLIEIAKAHATLDALVAKQESIWQSLCKFHFTQEQIDKHSPKFFDSTKTGEQTDGTWRRVFFELKKYYGLREVYADLIHICCHCKALFWKDHGHPCVSKDPAPSVRVMPRQFVDMLLFL
ncbi:F-box only protein 25 [Ditylenchus destructor]|uniref:F-box only protein 25 n=1 Tax=Ditylenchus destructor TaxID=166010 RepID=A0AAD4NA09_9BILA|nr:F-box only protein 25 [Ditylenchus destructor]